MAMLLRTVWSVAVCAALVSLAGCCQQPATDLLVLNNTKASVKAMVQGAEAEPIIILPGKVGLVLHPPGEMEVVLTDEASGKVLKSTTVHFRFEDSGLMTVAPETCAVIANYTEQYGDRSGKITTEVRVGPEPGAGRVERQEMTILLGPGDIMPEELNEFAHLYRLTEVPCALIADDTALERHLAHLK